MASGYLAEIEKMHAAVMESLRRHASEPAPMSNPHFPATSPKSALVMVGSGPSYGTALFSAAKVVEAAGILAIGQDLEEWWHIERFAYPVDMPVFVIAPPGRSYWRAGDLAATAHALGRRVIAVTHKDDTEVTRHAHTVLPVQGQVREEFSPLLYHLFANYVAFYIAARLGRSLFQSDRPELPQLVDGYYASLRQEEGFTTIKKEATMKNR